MNTPFEREFNGLQESVTFIEKIDSQNGEKTENKDRMLQIKRPFVIFEEFFSILKSSAKNWLNTAFEREFNALQESVTFIEKIDSQNGEKTENKDRMLHIQRLFLIFDELFPILESTGKTG